jgi:hypothetical protein
MRLAGAAVVRKRRSAAGVLWEDGRRYRRLVAGGGQGATHGLAPLAIIAIGGLMVSTFLTMVYVPVVYSLFEDGQEAMHRLLEREGAEVEQGV